MRYLGFVAALVLTLSLVACGESSSSDSPEQVRLTKPTVKPPSGPPPKELVIEDVKEGSGPPARKGDRVVTHYVAVDETGNEIFSSWRSKEPLAFELGAGGYFLGFEEGVEGMKAGGRRKLSVPSELAYDQGPLFYVVDLVEVESQ